jgi:DNA helicase-2/ATP-dependent DNA helicase PcrA
MFRIRRICADIEMELFRHSIPYTHKRGAGFFTRRVVQEVIAYATLVLSWDSDEPDPSELISHAVETVINVPDRKIGFNTIKELKESAGQRSLLRYMRVMPPSAVGPLTIGKIRKFLELVHKMRIQICEVNESLSTDTALQMIVEMAHLADEEPQGEMQGEIEALDEINDALADYTNDRKETLELLVEEARRFHRQLMQLNPPPVMSSVSNLQKFINAITLEGKSEMSKNAVTLSTIHQMKGLESPICFLMRFNQGVLPVTDVITEENGSAGSMGGQSLEEERRIAYVAITRARDLLFISLALSARGKELGPSQFLSEIEGTCVTQDALTEAEAREARELMAYVDDDFDDIEIACHVK